MMGAMVARSMSTATISFGLVTVPIRLYAASESQAAVSFNLLHEKCKSRLKQQYICPKDEEIVTRDQMVKGYEFAKDQYVVFTEDEIKSMAEEASKTIEITEFVPLAKVDPIYFEGAYYLGPDKGGEKAYRLLTEAMRQTGRCALAKWAARGKQYLTLMRPIEGGLIMQVLNYADEVRPFSRRTSSAPRPTSTRSARAITKPSSARSRDRKSRRPPLPKRRRARSSISWKRSRRAWPRRDRGPSPPRPRPRPRPMASRPSARRPRARRRRGLSAHPRRRRAASGADHRSMRPSGAR